MNNLKKCLLLAVLTSATVVMAGGTEGANRPKGFRWNGLTLSPFVNLSYTYDSNVDSSRNHGRKDSVITVSPAVEFSYNNANNFNLNGNVWYGYGHYCKYSNALNSNSYGEQMNLEKVIGGEHKKGWTLVLSESYQRIEQSDGFTSDDGRGIWRDRETVTVNAAVERRFSDKFHSAVNAGYQSIDYLNKNTGAGGYYGALYGWSRWTVGADVGYAFTRWTDLIISGSYMQYGDQQTGRSFSSTSKAYTAMTGIGSHATKQISYRVLTGLSRYDYGNDNKMGWTYQLSANWKITDRWGASLAGSSYYQPSERTANSAVKIYTLSAGTSYRFTDKITGTLDASYRHEQRVIFYGGSGGDCDYLAFRAGLRYQMNRYTSLFGDITYQMSDYEGGYNDYDRYRGTLGVQFRY